jgi:hypothetical protein
MARVSSIIEATGDEEDRYDIHRNCERQGHEIIPLRGENNRVSDG